MTGDGKLPDELELDRTDPYALYTRQEAADFLRVSVGWLHELINSGQLHTIKVGRRRLVPRASLTAYIRGDRLDGGLEADALDHWPPTVSMFADGDQ